MLVWETGTGKTVAACNWMLKRKGRNTLIACPKNIVGKWKDDIKEWGVEADIVSRDQIKKMDLKHYDNLVLDEAQDFSSPLFDGKRSQRAEKIYNFIKSKKGLNILLLTATPVRSTPWNIHTLACYLGKYWDVKKFRDEFFYLTDMFGTMHWEKKPHWQKNIRPYIEAVSDIVLMQDCIDVPVQHHQVIEIPWSKKQEQVLKETTYEEPAKEWHTRHRLENGDEKLEELENICDGYRKVMVVCHYRDQIDYYQKMLGKSRQVFVLHGGVKDQYEVIKEAREADDCIFIVQAQMGAGFDASEFSIVVFASMSFRYVDYVQMKGRVKRINNLHENIFIHLLGGKCDKAVYNAIQENRDFDVHDYLSKK